MKSDGKRTYTQGTAQGGWLYSYKSELKMERALVKARHLKGRCDRQSPTPKGGEFRTGSNPKASVIFPSLILII